MTSYSAGLFLFLFLCGTRAASADSGLLLPYTGVVHALRRRDARTHAILVLMMYEYPDLVLS